MSGRGRARQMGARLVTAVATACLIAAWCADASAAVDVAACIPQGSTLLIMGNNKSVTCDGLYSCAYTPATLDPDIEGTWFPILNYPRTLAEVTANDPTTVPIGGMPDGNFYVLTVDGLFESLDNLQTLQPLASWTCTSNFAAGNNGLVTVTSVNLTTATATWAPATGDGDSDTFQYAVYVAFDGADLSTPDSARANGVLVQNRYALDSPLVANISALAANASFVVNVIARNMEGTEVAYTPKKFTTLACAVPPPPQYDLRLFPTATVPPSAVGLVGNTLGSFLVTDDNDNNMLATVTLQSSTPANSFSIVNNVLGVTAAVDAVANNNKCTITVKATLANSVEITKTLTIQLRQCVAARSSSRVSSDAPIAVMEGKCTPVTWTFDRAVAGGETVQFTWIDKGTSGCEVYTTSGCTGAPVTSTTGPLPTLYLRCRAATVSARLMFDASGASALNTDSAYAPSPYIYPIQSLRFSTPASITQYQCSSALQLTTNKALTYTWGVSLTPSVATCDLFSDAACTQALPASSAYFAASATSTSFYVRCRTAPTDGFFLTANVEGEPVCSDGISITASTARVLSRFIVAESDNMPSAANTISFKLEPSVELSPGDKVLITGLTGTTTADSASLAVAGANADLFGSTAGWVQASGALTLTVAAGKKVVTGSLTTVSVVLANGAAATARVTPQGSIDGGATRVAGAAVLGADGGFTVRNVGRAIPFDISSTAIVTITLRPVAPLPAGTVVTITGLTQSTQSDSKALLIDSLGVFGSIAVSWTKTSGTLVLVVAPGQTVSSTADTVIKAPLPPVITNFNPATPTVRIGALPTAAMSGAVLFVPALFIKTVTVTESNNVAGLQDTMTVTITPNAPLSSGQTVIFSNFTGSRTTDTSSLSISGTTSFASTATWVQSTGTLTLTTTAAISAATTFSFPLLLPNAPSKATIPSISVAGNAFVSSNTPMFSSQGGFSDKVFYETTKIVSAQNQLCFQMKPPADIVAGRTIKIFTLINTQTVNNAALAITGPAAVAVGGSAPWTQSTGTLTMTVQSGFTIPGGEYFDFCITLQNRATASATGITPAVQIDTQNSQTVAGSFNSATPDQLAVFDMTESSNTRGLLNRLTFTIRPAADITAGTTLTIKGLTSSPTVSTTSLPVGGTDAALFQSTASWTQSSGTLVFTAAGTVPASRTSSFYVEVLNPNSARTSAISLQFTLNAGTLISRMGGRAKFRGDGGFSTATALQGARPAPGFTKAITIIFKSWLGLYPGQTIVVSGLDSNTSSNAALPLYGADAVRLFGGTGVWSKSAGTLTLTLAKQLFATETITLSFDLGVGSSPVYGVVPKIAVDSNAAVTMTGKVLYEPFDITGSRAVVHASTDFPGVSNTLTLSLRPNLDFAAGTVVVIDGLKGTQTNDNATLALGGPNADVFGGTGVWVKTTGTLTLTVAAGKTFNSSQTTDFTIDVTNGASQTAVTPTLSIGGSTPIPFTSPAALAFAGDFAVRNVRVSNSIPSSNNTLTFTVRPTEVIPAGRSLDVKLMTGVTYGAPATGTVSVGGFGASLFLPGTWTMATDTLRLTLAGDLPSCSETSFTFAVVNPSSTPSGPMSIALGTPRSFSPSPVLLAGGFSTKSVAESTAVPGADNTLTFVIAARSSIAINTVIIIEGLVGMQTAAGSVALGDTGATKFGSTATFLPSLGRLTLVATSSIPSGANQFSVTLKNGAAAQTPPAITIRIGLFAPTETMTGSGTVLGFGG